MLTRQISYILILLCSSLFTISAQEIHSYIQADSSTLEVGAQLNVRLGVRHTARQDIIKIRLESIEDAGWEIVHRTPLTHTEADNNINSYIDMRITSWDAGIKYILPVEVNLSANGINTTYHTDSLKIIINQIQKLEETPRGLKDIHRTPFPRKAIIYISLIIVLILFLSLIIYRYASNKKPQLDEEKKEEITIPDPAHTTAFKRLEALKDRNLIEKDEIHTFQTELTHIMRQFLGKVYDFNALESTTSEIMQYLDKVHIYQNDLKRMQEFLAMADLVKFAKAKPTIEFHTEMLDFAFNTVKKLTRLSLRRHNIMYPVNQEKE